MAAILAGRTQLPLQEQHTAILGGVHLAATLQPFTVGIVNPLAQSQAALERAARFPIAHTLGQLLIEQGCHQPPSFGSRRLFQRPLGDGVALLQRQVGGQQGSSAPTGRCGRAWLTAGEQHLCRLPMGLQTHQVVGQQIECRPLARLPAGSIRFGHRQLEALQPGEIAVGQQGQGLHRLGVVQTRMGGAPLRQQPSLSGLVQGGAAPLQHRQGRPWSATGQQGLRAGQSLSRGGLGREDSLQAALLLAQAQQISALAQGPTLVDNGVSQRWRRGERNQDQRRKPGQRLPQWGEKMGHGAHSCWLGVVPAT